MLQCGTIIIHDNMLLRCIHGRTCSDCYIPTRPLEQSECNQSREWKCVCLAGRRAPGLARHCRCAVACGVLRCCGSVAVVACVSVVGLAVVSVASLKSSSRSWKRRRCRAVACRSCSVACLAAGLADAILASVESALRCSSLGVRLELGVACRSCPRPSRCRTL